MIKHALMAAAVAVSLLSPATANAAEQRCPAVCSDICDQIVVADICSICLLPESSPVVPCLFGG